MSETLDIAASIAAPFEAQPPPPVHGASLADINEKGEWLIPRMCEHWATSQHHAIAYLRGTLASNEQRLMCCGDAIGMAHIEPGRMGHPPRVVVDFVLSKHGEAVRRGEENAEESAEIFAWFAGWAKTLGASGLYRVDDFTDVERSFIRARIGKLRKREVFDAIFPED